ncbi:MAG: DUF5654 family protein [Candidatus Thermoplasmatota archaeon]
MAAAKAEEKRLSVAEVRKTISTSLAAAFGFVIALLWNQVVQGGLAAAGVSTTAPKDWPGWAVFVVTAVILTLVMIVLILVISRWGSKD